VSGTRAVYEAFSLGAGTSTLTWLPLSHIAARSAEHFMILLTGGVIWLAESPNTVLTNLAEVEPTNVTGVPRFYEKLFAALHSLEPADRKVRLRALFGQRVNWVTCGSAPLSPTVVEEFREAGLPILEGYGMTETAGVLTCNLPDQWRVGTVGKPLPGVQMKTAPDGEILVRGPMLMAGYWNDPRQTGETIRDGWLHTGDIGTIDDDGYLTITGRKKDVLVLSTGKKVTASEVERKLLSDRLVDQVVVYGEGRSFLTAVIVPRGELRERLKDGETDGILRELSEHVDGALGSLPPEMKVKRFLVLRQEFSAAEGELTDTLKPRRAEIIEKHRLALDRLYALPRTDDRRPLAQLV
jgi:long-chain acyl-CoA synthetase